MSMYYSPEMVRLLMEERIREAREVHNRCCEDFAPERPRRSLRNLFRRETPASCHC
jgi:hypothetical protein